MDKPVPQSKNLGSLEQSFAVLQAWKANFGQKSLCTLSEQAFQRLRSRGMPTRQEESWRYTPTRDLLSPYFAPQTEINVINMEILQRAAMSENRLVFINGVYTRALSQLPGDGSIAIRPLAMPEAIGQVPDYPLLLSKNLVNPADFSENFLSLLSQAFLCNGFVVEILPGSNIKEPLHFIHLSTHEGEQNTSAFSHINLNVGENAKLVFVESFHAESEKDEYIVSKTQHIQIASGAECERVRMQSEGEKARFLSQDVISIAQGGFFHDSLVHAGAQLGRQELFVYLNGEEARVELNGLFHLKEDQHGSFYTQIEHRAARTHSKQCYKGILRGKSRGVFNGRVIIPQEIRECTAHQLSRNLLLSNDSEIDTKPELLISNNDVQCSHGATVTQLNPEELFYLRSRGIKIEDAQKFLIRAFINELLEKIAHEKIRERAGEMMVLSP